MKNHGENIKKSMQNPQKQKRNEKFMTRGENGKEAAAQTHTRRCFLWLDGGVEGKSLCCAK